MTLKWRASPKSAPRIFCINGSFRFAKAINNEMKLPNFPDSHLVTPEHGGLSSIGVNSSMFEQHEEFCYGFCATDAYFTLAQRGTLLQGGLLVG
jgi:hypothetical protein